MLGVLVIAAGLWIFQSLRRVPGELAAGGAGIVREARRLADAFRQGTVTRRFTSYASSIHGTQRLQVATVEETAAFELADEGSVLWGALELPAVVVRATAPVETTYFVDLQGVWHLELEGREVRVLAPPLRFNKPAIDASRIRYEVRQGSIVRDEQRVLAELKRGLTGRSAIRARENLPRVRVTARRQVEGFVRTWLLQQFDDAETYRVEVIFADESAGGGEPARGIAVPPQ